MPDFTMVTIEGQALRDLLDELAFAQRTGRAVHTLTVSGERGTTLKYKINGNMWSPPYLFEHPHVMTG